MGNFSKRPLRLNAYNWNMLSPMIAKRLCEDLSNEDLIEQKTNEAHAVLSIVADLLWDGYCREARLTEYSEKKSATKDLKQAINPDSIYYLLVAQGAKQDLYDMYPRGKGIGSRQKNEDQKQSNPE